MNSGANRHWRVAAALAVALLASVGAFHAADVVRPSGSDDLDVGALVDGERDGSTINDAVYSDVDLRGFFGALFPRVLLDNFTASDQSNEVIVFARDRVPLLVENVPWTPGNNAVDVDLQPALEIPITVWIVAESFEDVRTSVEEAVVTTSAIWRSERQGLRFGEVEIVDATDNAAADTLQSFTCGNALSYKQSIGYREGRFNVYYVTEVDFGDGFSPFNGVWCSAESIIGMGALSDDSLLSHELGHGFSLVHIHNYTNYFDGTNVMHNSSSFRRYLTEGQTYRSIYQPYSSLNDLYDVRQGQRVRSCPHHISEHNVDCPAVQQRVWADGLDWPAN
jgi:hypothetical protein